MKVRKHIFFTGRVQGVDFRYTAVHLARPPDLTGWVKNLWDGRQNRFVFADADEQQGYGRYVGINTVVGPAVAANKRPNIFRRY